LDQREDLEDLLKAQTDGTTWMPNNFSSDDNFPPELKGHDQREVESKGNLQTIEPKPHSLKTVEEQPSICGKSIHFADQLSDEERRNFCPNTDQSQVDNENTSYAVQFQTWERDLLEDFLSSEEKLGKAKTYFREEETPDKNAFKGSDEFNEKGDGKRPRERRAKERSQPRPKPTANTWSYKKFEPKSVTKLESVTKSKHTQRILERKNYISPYSHRKV